MLMTILKISTMLRENKKNICKAFIIIQCHSGYFLRHSPSSMKQFATKPPRTIPSDDHVEKAAAAHRVDTLGRVAEPQDDGDA